MRKSIFIVWFLIVVLFLSACSSNKTRSSTPSGDSGKVSTPAAIPSNGNTLADDCIAGKKTYAGAADDPILEIVYEGYQPKVIDRRSVQACHYVQTDLRIKDDPEADAVFDFYQTAAFRKGEIGGLGYQQSRKGGTYTVSKISDQGICETTMDDPAAPVTGWKTEWGADC